MTLDDPRHGSAAGATAHYRAAQKPCQPCLDAAMRAKKVAQLYPPKTPALGSQRRVQALQAAGYSRTAIARELGYVDAGALAYLMKPTTRTLLRVTAARITEVYDRLSMTVPTGPAAARARTWARRHGHPTPLCWDDDSIDDPAAHPRGRRHPRADYDSAALVDENTVDRILAGEVLPANRAERLEVMRRWLASGRSERSLCIAQGWKASRYVTRKEGVA